MKFKFINNRKISLPLAIIAFGITACLDPINKKQVEPPKEEIKIDTTKARAQIVHAKVGYYLQE